MPGLIDAHCHLTSDMSPEPRLRPAAGAAERRRAAGPRELGHYVLANAARALLAAGITDGARRRQLRRRGDRAAPGRRARPRSTARGSRRARGSSRRPSPGGAIFGTMYREADGPWEMRKAVREQLRRGAEFVKVMATGARSVAREDPEPAQLTREELDARGRRGAPARASASRRTPRASTAHGSRSRRASTRSSTASRCTASRRCSPAWPSDGIVLVPTLTHLPRPRRALRRRIPRRARRAGQAPAARRRTARSSPRARRA